MLPSPNPTESYWTRSRIPLPSPSPSPPRASPASTTILVLGTGITAASTASSLLALTPSTTHLVVLDARSHCDGATGRNGGHCKLVPYEELDKLSRRFGEERAVELVRFQMRHLECFREVCQVLDEGVDEEERRTEFRDVETVDIFLERDLFEEAKGKVERLRRVMPEVEVHVWEPAETREVITFFLSI